MDFGVEIGNQAIESRLIQLSDLSLSHLKRNPSNQKFFASFYFLAKMG